MEKQLFTWDGWDEQDVMTFTFFNVETIKELPGIPVGTKFSSATMCYDNEIVEFYDDNDAIAHQFYLNLEVVPAPIFQYTTNRFVRAQQIEQMDLAVCDDHREKFDALIEKSWCVDDDKAIADNVLAMDELQANVLYRELRKLRYNVSDLGAAVDADLREIAEHAMNPNDE